MMETNKYKEYSYIWNEKKDGYILIKTEYGYAIVDKTEKSMLVITDEALEDIIIDNMLKCGNSVYDSMDQAFNDK